MLGDADFTTEIDGVRVAVTVRIAVAVTAAPPPGGVPLAVAVLLIAPESASA